MTESDGEAVRYGRLTVLGENGRARSGEILWRCRCTCGTIKTFQKWNVVRGASRSCGCLAREVATKHGASYTKAYAAWNGMHKRCRSDDPRYGGRGIHVCDRWADFQAFSDDMGEPPTKQHSLDRIDNDGPYSPDNCRWATWSQQASNRSSNRTVEFDGRKLLLTEWSKVLGIKLTTLRMRLKMGWPVERALTTEPREYTKA